MTEQVKRSWMIVVVAILYLLWAIGMGAGAILAGLSAGPRIAFQFEGCGVSATEARMAVLALGFVALLGAIGLLARWRISAALLIFTSALVLAWTYHPWVTYPFSAEIRRLAAQSDAVLIPRLTVNAALHLLAITFLSSGGVARYLGLRGGRRILVPALGVVVAMGIVVAIVRRDGAWQHEQAASSVTYPPSVPPDASSPNALRPSKTKSRAELEAEFWARVRELERQPKSPDGARSYHARSFLERLDQPDFKELSPEQIAALVLAYDSMAQDWAAELLRHARATVSRDRSRTEIEVADFHDAGMEIQGRFLRRAREILNTRDGSAQMVRLENVIVLGDFCFFGSGAQRFELTPVAAMSGEPLVRIEWRWANVVTRDGGLSRHGTSISTVPYGTDSAFFALVPYFPPPNPASSPKK